MVGWLRVSCVGKLCDLSWCARFSSDHIAPLALTLKGINISGRGNVSASLDVLKQAQKIVQIAEKQTACYRIAHLA